MSTEPYVPNDREFVETYVSALNGATPVEDPERAAEARRGIAKIEADALRKAADDLNARANRPSLIGSADKWAGWYGGVRAAMQSEESALRLRADRIEEEA